MKDQIIEIAIEQLHVGGYDTLNFAAIAAALNTTRANLHHHFKNKEGLGAAALKQYIEDNAVQMKRLEKQHDGDLVGLLTAIEDHLIRAVEGDQQPKACVCSQFVRDSDAPESLRRLALERFREEAAIIGAQVHKHCASASEECPADADSLAFRVVTAMHGISMIALVEPDSEKLVARIRGSLTSLLG